MNLSLKNSLLAAGLVLVPSAAPALDLIAPPTPPPQPAEARSQQHFSDSRLAKLKSYFRLQRVPVAHLAEEFLRAADQHGLDWRLLPTIAVIETGAGRYSHNNNIFGWGNGRLRFPSVQASIEMVARSMATMSCYRGKTLEGVLWTYNPVRGYSEKIFQAMKTLDPEFRKGPEVMLPASQPKPSRSSFR